MISILLKKASYYDKIGLFCLADKIDRKICHAEIAEYEYNNLNEEQQEELYNNINHIMSIMEKFRNSTISKINSIAKNILYVCSFILDNHSEQPFGGKIDGSKGLLVDLIPDLNHAIFVFENYKINPDNLEVLKRITSKLNYLMLGNDLSSNHNAHTDPNFTKWFKDSQTVDHNNTPRVLYHATNKDFSEFKNFHDPGFHFGTKKQANYIASLQAEKGLPSRVLPVYLAVKNPLRIHDLTNWNHLPAYLSYLVETGRITHEESQRTEALWEKQVALHKANIIKKNSGYLTEENFNHSPNMDELSEPAKELREKESIITRDYLENLGYDGVVYDNQWEGTGDSYMAFRPNQIKSAIGNNKFNPDDPDFTK